MSQQPNLFTPEPEDAPNGSRERARMTPVLGGQREGKSGRQQHSRWLERTELLVRVIVRLYLGLLIIALPWLRLWTENGLFSYTRGTELLATSGFLRGMVSGLGLLNVAIALQEIFAPGRKR
jgi:hypothetical protein